MVQPLKTILSFLKFSFKKLEKANKNDFLLLVLIFIGLFIITETAQALPLIGDIPGWAKAALKGVVDAAAWVFNMLWLFFIFIGLSAIFVGVSGALLNWVIRLPINLMNNPIVEAGWGFVLDLVNLFFIIALVAIAMAFILKIESFELKKSLPRLIIIALLVNFSLVFIGMFLDIALIFQNTILEILGEGIINQVIHSITAMASTAVTYIGGKIAVMLAGLALPGVDLAIALTKAGWTIVAFPIILHWIFLIFFNVIIGLVFLFYFFLFLIRIVVIWILAIFAPLALLAYILPVTKQYFDLWLKTLLSWVFLGIVALFLLAIGLGLMSVVAGQLFPEPIKGLPIPIIGLWDFPQFIAYYFFLFVYLIVAFYFSFKIVPAGVSGIMATFQSAAFGTAKVAAGTFTGTFIGAKLAGIEGRIGASLSEAAIKQPEGSIMATGLSRMGRYFTKQSIKHRGAEVDILEKQHQGETKEQKVTNLAASTNKLDQAVESHMIATSPGAMAEIRKRIDAGGPESEKLVNHFRAGYEVTKTPEFPHPEWKTDMENNLPDVLDYNVNREILKVMDRNDIDDNEKDKMIKDLEKQRIMPPDKIIQEIQDNPASAKNMDMPIMLEKIPGMKDATLKLDGSHLEQILQHNVTAFTALCRQLRFHIQQGKEVDESIISFLKGGIARDRGEGISDEEARKAARKKRIWISDTEYKDI